MDLIDRQAAIDAMSELMRHWFGGDTKDEVKEIKRELEKLPTVQTCEDVVSRQQAIDALWKALYAYEDETEKQFIESEELDVGDWIHHRIFVQNMSDIDRQTILNLPSAQPEQKSARWTKAYDGNDGHVKCTCCFKTYDWISQAQYYNFCPNCGADMRGDKDDIPMEYFENGGI